MSCSTCSLHICLLERSLNMLKGEKVLLRPMTREDIARQHQFNQDPELYVLDSTRPCPAPLEMAESFYEHRNKGDDSMAAFAIEADEVYIGSCELMGLNHPHGNY